MARQLSEKSRQRIIQIAGQAGFEVKLTADGSDIYHKVIMLDSPFLQHHLYIHKDVGVNAAGNASYIVVAVHPDEFRTDILDSNAGIQERINQQTGENLFLHSAYRGFPNSPHGNEPAGKCYRLRNNSALATLLEKLASPHNRNRSVIKAITLGNFKGVREKIRIELKPITLLFGPNSAGKSTIFQALVYAREILHRHNLDPDRTELGGEWMDLGGFRSLVNSHNFESSISLGFELDLSESGVPTYLTPLEEHALESSEHQRTSDEWLDKVQQAEVRFSISWSDQMERPFVDSVSIEINYQDFAILKCSNDARQIHIESIDTSHEILADFPGDEDEATYWFVEELLQSSLNPSIVNPSLPIEDMDLNSEETVNAEVLGQFDSGIYRPIGLLSQPDALPVRNRRLQFSPDIWASSGYDYSPYSDHPLAAELLITSVLSGLIVGPLDVLNGELEKLLYLGPFREIPDRRHGILKSPDSSRWARGSAAWDLLLTDPSDLVERVNRWLESDERLGSKYRIERRIFKLLDVESLLFKVLSTGLNIEKEEYAELFKTAVTNLQEERELKIIETDTGYELDLADLGVGVSQVIPVIVAALNARSGLVSIEQPELHVHPAWQTALGDLFISSSANSDVNFIIETHSEHLMLRILRRIRETFDDELPPGAPSMTPDNVSIYFIENGDGGVEASKIRVDESGEFKDKWPRGFFKERREELM